MTKAAHGGLRPEPIMNLPVGTVGTLGHPGLVVKGFQVVNAVADELRDREVLGPLFHVRFFAADVALKEPDHTPETPLGDGAQPHRRAAAVALAPLLVIGPERREFVGGVQSLFL